MTSRPTKALLLDIEGTVTPISFVHDVLFPFARNHVKAYLIKHSTTPVVQEDIQALVREHETDVAGGEQPPKLEGHSTDSVVGYVNWLIDRDRKSPALKSLQGKIWDKGYRDGVLKAPLFDDVVPNLKRLRGEGFRVAIFSSGSVLAQKLLFAHTETGDHTNLIEQYFDTDVGSKVDRKSYVEIARRLKLSPSEVTFVSDVTNELKAAREAGMATLLCVRPGNQPQPLSDQFKIIKNFSEII